MNRKFVFIIFGTVLLATSLFFLRFKIWRTTDLEGGQYDLENITKPIFSSSTTTETEKGENTAKLPLYKGRDPQEFKPDPNVVNSFTDQQKTQLSDDIKKYGEMVSSQPEYASAWLQVGLLKQVIGDYIGTRDAWEYVALTRPKEQVAFKNLADLYWRYLLDNAKAEYNFKKAISLKPEDISTYIDFAEFYGLSGKNELALSILKQGLAANPESLDLIKAIASFYDRQKDYQQALDWWQKALEKYPDDDGISQMIEEIKEKMSK